MKMPYKEILGSFFKLPEIIDYLIELKLGIRKVVKLEENFEEYSDEIIFEILKDFELEDQVVYGKVIMKQEGFLIFSFSQKYINNFFVYNYCDNYQKRAIGAGKLLGYPDCCIKKYIAFFDLCSDRDIEIDLLIKGKNNLEFNGKYKESFIFYHSCNKNCVKTKEIIDKKLNFISENLDFINYLIKKYYVS